MLDKKIIDKLNRLIALDIDAVGAYDSAIRACNSGVVKERLGSFKADHERHVRDLSEAVRLGGGTPRTTRDLKGVFIQGFTAITSFGDQSALMAMRGNEELTTRTYKAALNDDDLPDTLRPLLQRNYGDEQRHLSWIQDALSRHVWEEHPPVQP
jgi:uncharacterized protein (TIGR02284 family)